MQDTTQLDRRADVIGPRGVEPSRFAPASRTACPERSSHSGKSSTTTVYVIDDDRSIRESMRDLLEESGYGVELFADGETFLDFEHPDGPGCLLIDAQLPGLGGIELLERLKCRDNRFPAILITGHAAVAMAVQAMKAGAVDFLEKPVRCHELLASIRRALDQQRKIAEHLPTRERAAQRVGRLTQRQRQILDLVLAGHPSKNIAADLGISQRTVENHRAAIMKTTGSRSIPDLVHTAFCALCSVSTQAGSGHQETEATLSAGE